jgi:VWFA-related protein
MRPLSASVAIAFIISAALSAQQPGSTSAPQEPPAQPQTPVFRAGVDLLSVDVTALDGNGRQVTDLTPNDFVVEVDGDVRKVATAEYVRLVDPFRIVGAPRKVAAPVDETFFSSNQKGAPSGRLILILVDQGNIRTGSARSSMMSAKKFVDSLEPEDRVAVVSVPSPGELVDFTVDHDKVREALLRVTGVQQNLRTRFNISITESFAVYMRSDAQMAAEVVLRECGQAGTAADLERCEREVEQDAAEIVNDIRHRSQDSIASMRGALRALAAIEGPKSVILISEGLILDGPTSDMDDLASVAADARASLDVLLLDVPRFDASQDRRPTTPREDRDLQVTGLEMLAGASRGTLYRVNTSAEFAFDRIARSLDGHYLLGVESRAKDRDGKRHQVSVKSIRRGVTIRSRRSFLTSVSAKATTPTDAVSRALRSPLPINDLPIRVSTWVYKEPGSSRLRILIAAEVERLADQSLDYTAGLILVNRNNRGMAPPVELRKLTAKEGDPGTAVYAGSITVDPGTYRLHLAMADSEGRVGSVTRNIEAWAMDPASTSVGDLLLGGLSTSGPIALSPAIEPYVNTGQMAAMVEVYGSTPDRLANLDAVLEVLQDEQHPALATMPMRVFPGQTPEIAAIHTQINTTALPPGRYLARTTVRQTGKPIGHLIRPFRIVATEATTGGGAPVAGAGGALPAEMASLLLGGLPAFDRKELLSPAMLAPSFAAAEARGAAAKAALKEARTGAYGAAAMTALTDGDQALASFLKGLDLLSQSQLDRAAVQFQSSMQQAPAFAPARLYLGAAMAEGNRHKEAAGLLQSAGADPAMAALGRIAGEEWMKAGQPALAIVPLEQALKAGGANADPRTRRLLGVAYVLGQRSADALPVLAPYLDANPADQAALLAAIFATYTRHLETPQRDTLAADRDRAAKWSKAYAASGGPMQPLVAAWVKHLEGLK